MKATILIALLATAMATPSAFADPVDDILEFARRAGYLSGDFVRPRFVRQDSAATVGDELLQMDYRRLRNVVLASSGDFEDWLSGIPAGEYWRKHFELRSLQEHLAPNVNASPTADERKTIIRILGILDQAVATPELDDITRIASARTLDTALRELVMPTDQRLLRQLSQSARMLNRSLGSLNTGVSWQKYLALPDEIIAAADKPPGDGEPRPEVDREKLGRILVRYDQVSQSQEYRRITSIPEFQATYQRLTAVVNPAPKATPPRPERVAEELPPPEPEGK